MEKRVVLVILAALVSAFVFAEGGAESETKAAASARPVELTVWTHEDNNRTSLENGFITEFQAANPNVKVTRVTYASNKIQEAVLTAFAANQGPDFFNMSIEDEYAYLANGRVAPVDFKAAGYESQKAILDNYSPGALDPVMNGGKLYGLPLELTNWCIYLNKKVFRSVGLDPDKDYPKTWEDVVAVSEKIAVRDGQILKRRGFDFRYPYYLISVVPMVEQLGGQLISDDGKTAVVNDKAWISLLTFFREWGPNGKNLGSPTYTAPRKTFNMDNNDIGMCISGLYQQGRIRADNPTFYNSGEWMVIPFPQFKNAVKNVPCNYYGHYYMVNGQKPKDNQQASWKLIGFMLSHPEDYLQKVDLVQPTKKLMDSETFKKMPYSSVFKNDLEKAHVVYYGANSAKIQDHVKTAVESVMMGGVTPEKALETLRRNVQEILDEQK